MTRGIRSSLRVVPGSIWWVLLFSLLLRFFLVFRGGQYFWADEGRYGVLLEAWAQWNLGNLHGAMILVAGTADHLGFKLLMLLPAWVQLKAGLSVAWAAAFLSLFSTANILWIWLIARRAGGDERESFWAAAMMAASTSMFYWSRHVMPYDLALFFCLACTYVAIRQKPGPGSSWLVGFLGFLAFITYNGCWSVVACVMVLHVLLGVPGWRSGFTRAFWMVALGGGLLVIAAVGTGFGRIYPSDSFLWWGAVCVVLLVAGFMALPPWRDLLRRLVLAGLGLVGPFMLLLLIASGKGIYLLDSYVSFAGSIVQGNYDDGHRVILAYLWHAEGLFTGIWLAALLLVIPLAIRSDREARHRAIWWLTIIVTLVSILVVGANFFEVFVVYGRLVRQIVPFLALLTGWTVSRLWANRPRWDGRERAAGATLLAIALWNFSTPLLQVYPVPFRARALAALPVSGKQGAAGSRAGQLPAGYRFVNADVIWPVPQQTRLTSGSVVVAKADHPMKWGALLYEVLDRKQRGLFESADLTMMLVHTGPEEGR